MQRKVSKVSSGDLIEDHLNEKIFFLVLGSWGGHGSNSVMQLLQLEESMSLNDTYPQAKITR